MLSHPMSSNQKYATIKALFENVSNDYSSDYDKILLKELVELTNLSSIDALTNFFEMLETDEIVSFEFSSEAIHYAIISDLELSKILRLTYIDSLHSDTKPAIVTYNAHSGLCTFNGHSCTLKKRNKKIFTKLYEHINEPINKDVLWKASGHSTAIADGNDVIEFNSYITNLRRALGGASPKQLRLRKNVELYGIAFLTDENDLKFLKYLRK